MISLESKRITLLEGAYLLGWLCGFHGDTSNPKYFMPKSIDPGDRTGPSWDGRYLYLLVDLELNPPDQAKSCASCGPLPDSTAPALRCADQLQ